METFSTPMWGLPHGNRKLSLPKWVILLLSLTPVILYFAIRHSMYLFSPLCVAPSGRTRWGSSFFGALFAPVTSIGGAEEPVELPCFARIMHEPICCDRGSGHPPLRAVGSSMRRNPMGAASSRDRMAPEARGSALQRRIVAALIVPSEAWRCSGGAHKIREIPLSAREGSGSGCALRRRPPCLRRRPVSRARSRASSGLDNALPSRPRSGTTSLGPLPQSIDRA
jgi:hypothetical protein